MVKDFNYYMNLKYPFELIQDEDGSWFIQIPDLPGCMSCAETRLEAFKMIEDAKAGYIEIKLEDGYNIPEPTKHTEQEWYWTEQWQSAESKVDVEKTNGLIKTANSLDELIEELEK